MTASREALADELRQQIKGIVRADEPMSRHTSLGIGGPADLYAEPACEDDVIVLLRECKRLGLPWFPMGDGQNLLVSDKGVRGLALRLGKPMSRIEIDETRMVAGAGAKLMKAVDMAVQHGLAGLEGATGVPGTIGGAIVMNAGTRVGYIGDVVQRVRLVDGDGVARELTREELEFSYKTTGFQSGGSIITEAEFQLRPSDKAELLAIVERLRRSRATTQPVVGKSAGCMFKNPPDQHAGYLIEQAGLKGMRVGDAEVSDKHGNFLMNAGGATAEQMLALAERVRQIVKERYGLALEYEVRLVGDWPKVE